MKLKDLTGNTYGRLTVLEELPNRRSPITGKSYVFWKCKCDCGNVHAVNGTSLKAGTVKSCGCLRQEVWSRIYQTRNKIPKSTTYGKCGWCGGDIHAKPSRKLKMKFCSHKCFWNASRSERKIKCLTCGNIIEKRPSVAKKFCSYECFQKYRNDGNSPFRLVLGTLLTRSQYGRRGKRKHPDSKKLVAVSMEDIRRLWEKQKGICPYTGWKMVLKQHYDRGQALPNQASLDRQDSSKGYILGNIQFISVIANYAKNSFTEKELFDFCDAVSRNIHRPF